MFIAEIYKYRKIKRKKQNKPQKQCHRDDHLNHCTFFHTFLFVDVYLNSFIIYLYMYVWIVNAYLNIHVYIYVYICICICTSNIPIHTIGYFFPHLCGELKSPIQH